MKITIYQIIPELDQDRLMFLPLSYFQKAGYPSPPAEIYESVFCGETEVATLEETYRIFNRKDEADARYLEKIGFTGHSMSVSDILEIQHSPGESRFYFCDTFGFSQIAFQKENAMLPVQNHDNIPFEQVNRSKPGYLGCGLAGGDWETVYSKILIPLFSKSCFTLTILYLPDSIRRLWTEFGDIPMDPETECIEQSWHGFPAGTHREEIWHWFEETFQISVAEDLMYPDNPNRIMR